MGKCTDCENYDNAMHYCPTFCEVIRNTCRENKEYYIEQLEEMKLEIEDNKTIYLNDGLRTYKAIMLIIDEYIEKAKEDNNGLDIFSIIDTGNSPNL